VVFVGEKNIRSPDEPDPTPGFSYDGDIITVFDLIGVWSGISEAVLIADC